MKKIKSLVKHKHAERPSKEIRGAAQKESNLQNLLYDDHGGVIIGQRNDPPRF
jgi:hypothetical protein